MITFKALKFWEQEPFIQDITKNFAKKGRTKLIKSIESDVLKWLKDDDADSILQIDLADSSGQRIYLPIVLFSRAEIYIKSAANNWEVWRIATSSCYPKMISYKVKTIGTNEYEENFVLPNEIRGQNYSTKEVAMSGFDSGF